MDQTSPKDDFRSTLRTIDAKGARKWVYAEVMGGAWRRRRNILAVVLVGFFLVAPWIVVDGYPLMQVDFFNRKLVLLGKVFLAHELNLFLTAVLGTIFGIYALTAWGGRVFCGWVCPTTPGWNRSSARSSNSSRAARTCDANWTRKGLRRTRSSARPSSGRFLSRSRS